MWLAPERQALEELAASLVEQVAQGPLREEQAVLALTRARELLQRDPLRETLYQAAMRLLMRLGKLAEANRLYRDCRAVLERELGVAPSDQTTAVLSEITQGEREIVTTAAPNGVPSLQERPVIAVLPFQNISGDASLSIICEGLAEDITSGLGAFRLLNVIDRHSASAVVRLTTDAREIGAKLGADLVLQGSLQRTVNGFRFGVRLVEAETRTQRWAGQFNVLEADLLTAPERIMAAILPSINAQVETSLLSRSRRKTMLASYEHLLLGIKHLRGYQPDDNANAIAQFDKALGIDPGFALAIAYRGFADVVLHGYDASPPDVLASAIARIRSAADLEPDEPRIWWLLGMAVSYTGDYAAEEQFIRRAAELNPNDANTLAALALVTANRGQREEGLALIREAFRLNPFHPEWYWVDYGSLLYACNRYEEAIEAFLHRREPNVWVLSRLAACYAQLGRMEEAQATVAKVLSLKPGFRLSQQRTGSWSPQDRLRFREGMLKAGLPE